MRTLSAVFAGLLAILLLARVRRVVALSVVGVLICGVVIPRPVYAQLEFLGLFAAIDAVLNTINGVLKSLLDAANSVLSQINSIFQAFWNLMDTVVYPKALIARAQGMVSAMIGQFRALLTNIFNIGVSSAQLQHPKALESRIRNRSTSDIGQVAGAYTRASTNNCLHCLTCRTESTRCRRVAPCSGRTAGFRWTASKIPYPIPLPTARRRASCLRPRHARQVGRSRPFTEAMSAC